MKRSSILIALVSVTAVCIPVLAFALSYGQTASIPHTAAQSLPPPPPAPKPRDVASEEPLKQLKLESLSPYEIKVFITGNLRVSLKELWQHLGIDSVFAGERITDYPENFLDECEGCKADTFEYELDDEPGKEVLLRIEQGLSESCRYLIFKQTNAPYNSRDRWKFLGHIDHDFGRYRMPQHHVVMCGGRTWLVVEVQEGSGSGYSLYSSRLFKVDRSGLKELVKFPSEGWFATWSSYPPTDVSSRILNCEVNNGSLTVEVEFSQSYKFDRNLYLWSKKQRGVYKTDPISKKLVLDPSLSDITQEELDTVYADALSNKDFLKYHFDQLRKIATGESVERKEWLRAFLENCEETAEKTALIRLLGRQ